MPWREDNQVLIRQSAVYLMHLLCKHKSGVFENSGFRRDCSKVISVDFMKGSKTERWLLTLYTVTHICAHDTAQAHSTVLEIRSAKDWFNIQWVWFETLQCHLFHWAPRRKKKIRAKMNWSELRTEEKNDENF